MSLIRSRPKNEGAAIALVIEWLSTGKSCQRVAQKLSAELEYDEEKTIRIIKTAAQRLVAANHIEATELMAINVSRAETLLERAFEEGELGVVVAAMKVYESALLLPGKWRNQGLTSGSGYRRYS